MPYIELTLPFTDEDEECDEKALCKAIIEAANNVNGLDLSASNIDIVVREATFGRSSQPIPAMLRVVEAEGRTWELILPLGKGVREAIMKFTGRGCTMEVNYLNNKDASRKTALIYG